MIIISATDLRKDQKKYFDLAETEKVVIKRGRKLIQLVVSEEKLITDEDIKNGITAAELVQAVTENIKKFPKK